jgi:transposase
MIRDNARSPCVQRAYATKSTNRGTQVSTIGALSHNGLVAELCFEGTLNTHVFNYFIETLLVPKLQPENVIILDNASAHDPDERREILTPKGIQVLFLLTISPELNPIELIWSQMKNFMKKHTAFTQESLDQMISQAILNITPSNAFHCFQQGLKKMGIEFGVHPSG